MATLEEHSSSLKAMKNCVTSEELDEAIRRFNTKITGEYMYYTLNHFSDNAKEIEKQSRTLFDVEMKARDAISYQSSFVKTINRIEDKINKTDTNTRKLTTELSTHCNDCLQQSKQIIKQKEAIQVLDEKYDSLLKKFNQQQAMIESLMSRESSITNEGTTVRTQKNQGSHMGYEELNSAKFQYSGANSEFNTYSSTLGPESDTQKATFATSYQTCLSKEPSTYNSRRPYNGGTTSVLERSTLLNDLRQKVPEAVQHSTFPTKETTRDSHSDFVREDRTRNPFYRERFSQNRPTAEMDSIPSLTRGNAVPNRVSDYDNRGPSETFMRDRGTGAPSLVDVIKASHDNCFPPRPDILREITGTRRNQEMDPSIASNDFRTIDSRVTENCGTIGSSFAVLGRNDHSKERHSFQPPRLRHATVRTPQDYN